MSGAVPVEHVEMRGLGVRHGRVLLGFTSVDAGTRWLGTVSSTKGTGLLRCDASKYIWYVCFACKGKVSGTV